MNGRTHFRFNWFTKGILLLLLFSLSGCKQPNIKDIEQKSQDSSSVDSESRLILNNATLEQANAKGQILWKIQVEEATYSKDQKIAYLKKVKGNIYQNNQVVLYVSADKGEVYKSGEEIFLKDNIVATDPRNGAVIRSEEVEWHPQDFLLMVRKNLRGSHSQVDATAKEGRYHTKEQRLELVGNVVATAKDTKLQLTAETVVWKVPQLKLFSDRPLKLLRYQDKNVTDQIKAERVEVDLKTKIVTAEKNIEYRSIKPPIQIASNRIAWNYKDRLVTSSEPIRLLHYQDQITLTGNRGRVNLKDEIAYLNDGVQGVNSKTQAKLYANQLVWKMPLQIVEAIDNVIYEQFNPAMNLTGDKAVGTFKDNKIVVTSNSQERVVTEIFPEQ
jgi:LPS export ABC transporter protein LptC